ncbi:permease [Chryseobacterium sp. 6424]|uniref:DMT family transporter n=1 Tax=Chryseobacterium sp. 6424 TaxID=2039166 RepID=UPI000EFB7893|nr:EamA family transporter [Chryseobacterium sp. 6424]AYO58239.1 permease [Chryseobacterium sp. 6424]
MSTKRLSFVCKEYFCSVKIKKDYGLILAILTVAIVWGTTFLGIRVAVETIAPWYVAGIRQCIAALLLLGILMYRQEFRWIGWKNFFVQILFSVLMLVIANGMVTVAEEQVTSSLASLISAASPLVVFLGSVLLGLQKFTVRALAGVLMGFCGILLIFRDGLEDLLNPEYRLGIIFIFIAISGWAAGSIFTKKLQLQNQNISLNLFYQFAFAGIFQTLLGWWIHGDFATEDWSFKSVLATLYLAVFGSVAAYFAFHYALKKISPTQISLLSYVNTIIAIILGWWILDEEISAAFIAAAVLIIGGVFITNYQKGMFRRKRASS